MDGLERNISNVSKVSTNVTMEQVLSNTNVKQEKETLLENLQINRTNQKMKTLQQSATSDVTSVSKSASKSVNTNSNEDRISSYSNTNSSSERKLNEKKRILTSFNSNCINNLMTTDEIRSNLH